LLGNIYIMTSEKVDFEEEILYGFDKLKSALMKVDESSVHEEFDNLSDAEKLLIFAKKLIISKEDFDADMKIRHLLKENYELKTKYDTCVMGFEKSMLEKGEEIIDLNSGISLLSKLLKEAKKQREENYELFTKMVDKCETLEQDNLEVSYDLTCSLEEIKFLKEKVKEYNIISEDAYAYEVKCKMYKDVCDKLSLDTQLISDNFQIKNDEFEEKIAKKDLIISKARDSVERLEDENEEKDCEIQRLKEQIKKIQTLNKGKSSRLLALKASIKNLVNGQSDSMR